MAISFTFLIVMAVKALMVVCLSNETIQADRLLRHNKESLRRSIANSPEVYERLVSSGNVSPGINVKEKRQEKSQDYSNFKNEESAISTAVNHRSKRLIFNADNRKKVPRKYIEKCPFTAAVMISTGCSGILVSPRHVLTSAHCLHNGSHYVDGYRNLRVGFLLKNGTTVWHAVSSTKMTKQWKSGKDLNATMVDYALIKLSKNHSRCFLPIAPSKAFFYRTAYAHKAIHFTAFDEDREEGTMLYRTCRVETLSTNLLYHCCDATAGSSGAGVYEIHRRSGNKKFQRYVVGVFSGNRDKLSKHLPTNCAGRYSFNGIFFRQQFWYRVNYNAALRLDEDDVYHICTWMKKLGGENCKKFLKERRRRRRQSRKRREKHKDERRQGMS